MLGSAIRVHLIGSLMRDKSRLVASAIGVARTARLSIHGTPEEIVGKLRKAEIVLAQGATTPLACRRKGVANRHVAAGARNIAVRRPVPHARSSTRVPASRVWNACTTARASSGLPSSIDPVAATRTPAPSVRNGSISACNSAFSSGRAAGSLEPGAVEALHRDAQPRRELPAIHRPPQDGQLVVQVFGVVQLSAQQRLEAVVGQQHAGVLREHREQHARQEAADRVRRVPPRLQPAGHGGEQVCDLARDEGGLSAGVEAGGVGPDRGEPVAHALIAQAVQHNAIARGVRELGVSPFRCR